MALFGKFAVSFHSELVLSIHWATLGPIYSFKLYDWTINKLTPQTSHLLAISFIRPISNSTWVSPNLSMCRRVLNVDLLHNKPQQLSTLIPQTIPFDHYTATLGINIIKEMPHIGPIWLPIRISNTINHVQNVIKCNNEKPIQQSFHLQQ